MPEEEPVAIRQGDVVIDGAPLRPVLGRKSAAKRPLRGPPLDGIGEPVVEIEAEGGPAMAAARQKQEGEEAEQHQFI